MKVYIVSDLEGVACVFSRREGYINATEYGTMELVAICEELLSNGVKDITLNCFHIMEYHKFPKEVKFIHSEPTYDFLTTCLDDSYDALMITGMHAMSGGVDKGVWRHTISPPHISKAYAGIHELRINGRPTGEAGLIALFAGVKNVPTVYLSGDEWACREIEQLIPDIETLAVKKGLSFYSAISLHPEKAAELSAEASVNALKKRKDISPVKVEGNLAVEVDYTFPQRAADAMSAMKNLERVNETTVRANYKDVDEFISNFGCIRAPEDELHQKDIGYDTVTGFFTRTGPEPYQSLATSPYKQQIDFALTNWGK